MKKIIFLSVILLVSCISGTFAQCPVAVAPSYPTGCTSQYFTSITASGVGVVSTISYTSSSCTGSFFDMFSSEGVTAPTGSTVDVSISRVTGFSAYAAIYVDWNNNGVYELSELAGTVASLASSTASIVYSFTVPLTGIVTNTNLHMRVFLGEPPSAGGPLSSISPPCSAKWGESVDYYINASCTNPVLSISPASPSVCLGNSVALTASGAGPTPTYNWAPPASLSASTGATVTASPTVITTYTVTGYGPGVCTATKTTTVNVTPGITAVVSAGGPTTFCRGDGVLLSETSGSGSRYQWYDGAAAIPGATCSMPGSRRSATCSSATSCTTI